jgi:transposase-like protein
MPKSHPPAEYRQPIVGLALAGGSIDNMARAFELPPNPLRYWLRQAGSDERPHNDGLTNDERGRLNRLRHEFRMPREEREIAARVVVWGEAGTVAVALCQFMGANRFIRGIWHDVPASGSRPAVTMHRAYGSLRAGRGESRSHRAHSRDQAVLSRHVRRAANLRRTIRGGYPVSDAGGSHA